MYPDQATVFLLADDAVDLGLADQMADLVMAEPTFRALKKERRHSGPRNGEPPRYEGCSDSGKRAGQGGLSRPLAHCSGNAGP